MNKDEMFYVMGQVADATNVERRIVKNLLTDEASEDAINGLYVKIKSLEEQMRNAGKVSLLEDDTSRSDQFD